MREMENLDLQHGHDHDYLTDDLTDDQIQYLLKRASLRLQGQITGPPQAEIFSQSLTPIRSYKSDPQHQTCHLRCWRSVRFPKLNAETVAQPYVASNHGVARADAARVLTDNDRRLSEKVRYNEEPIEAKGKVAKVSGPKPSAKCQSPMRKISQFAWRRNPGPVLGNRFAPLRESIVHSYSEASIDRQSPMVTPIVSSS